MYVYALATCSTSHGGVTLRLKEGEAWAANDPFVKARPDLFSEVPPKVRRTVNGVEEATAVPGQKRRGRG